MDANGFLAVLAILVAAYSYFPNEKRLDIRLRIYWMDILFVSICVLVILAIVFTPVLEQLDLLLPFPWVFGFNGDLTIFLCLLIIITFFWLKITGHLLPVSRYSKWVEVSERLLRGKKLFELGYLFDKYHVQLLEQINVDPWYIRIRRFLSPGLNVRVTLIGSENKTSRYKLALNSIRSFFASLLPAESKTKNSIELSVSRILKSKQFVSFLAETHPIVGAKSTCAKFTDNDEFINTFFISLISHSDSPLYREIRDNQGSSYTGQYYIDESNALLSFYFKDISVASNVSIYRPIGEYLIEFIQDQRGQGNYYNQPCGKFYDGEERWSCPIFIGSEFFKIMISAAIFQRKKGHMWLMYCDYFIKEILSSLNPSPEVIPTDEFPTKFDYLLYHLFSICRGWVDSIIHVEVHDASSEEAEAFPEYWAAKTFGSMLRKIIYSDELTDAQKSYYLEMVIRKLNDLDQQGHRDYSELIIGNCIREYDHSPIDQDSLSMLDLHYIKVDHVLKSKDSTFEKMMKLNHVLT